MTNTLGDALPQEMARCRRLLEVYKEIGPAGSFAHAMIENDLKVADAAMVSGDLVAMIRSYEALKGCK